MSNSFYGGRDGQPFIIKKRYKTVADMLADFAQGPVFTDINFGEYKFIDTEDRANPESGRIFRRGYDYNNSERKISQWSFDSKNNTYTEQQTEAYGAVYIGRIAGTAGTAPHFQPVPYIDEKGKEHTLKTIKEDYQSYDTISGEGSFSIGQGNLVPGKNGDTFVDKITWQHCSVIKDKNNEKSTAYIGFTFPYTVIEWDANSVSPYYHRDDAKYDENWEVNTPGTSNNFNNLGLVEDARTENEKGHPFYQKWKINIPKGIHGQSIENLRVDVDEEGREVLKYEFRNYDAKEDGETKTVVLGDYNMIDSIAIDNNGTITINYTHDDNRVWENLLTWITEVNLSDTGNLNIKTNNHNKGTEIINKQLQWVKDITFNDEGTIVLHYIDGTTSGDTYKNLIDWIKSINIAQDGTVTVVSNNNTEFLVNQNKLKWVSGISLSNDGTLTTNYNNGNPTPQKTKLTWVASAETNIQNIGTVNEPENALMFNMKFNNATIPTVTANLTAPNKIELNTGVLTATYNTGEIETLGTVDTLSASTAATEEEVDSNLGIGGLWFITERAIER